MITNDPRSYDENMEQAGLYLWRAPDGMVVLVDGQGRMISGQIDLTINNGVNSITTATVTLHPEGWCED